MKIIYVLPSEGGGGGSHSIAQEVNEFIAMGIDASIAVLSADYAKFLTCYSDMPLLLSTIIPFADENQLAQVVADADLIVCTIFTSVRMVKAALGYLSHHPQVAYYAQDYEPLFYSPTDPLWSQARESYTLLPDMMVFAKTQWLCNVIEANHGIKVEKVAPSLDHQVYCPRLNKPQDKIWLTAMVRPSTPRRAPKRTMRILKNIKEYYQDKVDIHIFGCTDQALFEQGIARDFSFTNHGVLSRRQVALLLANSHLFLDLSDYQAFGRTGLEAMACACVALVPALGGTSEYIENLRNGLSVDTRNEHQIEQALHWWFALPEPEKLQMRRQALLTAQRFSVRSAAISELQAFNAI